MKGKFISLEGSEGSGKSTNLRFMVEWLIANGKEVVVTREPGGTPLAEEIRGMLLSPRDEAVNGKAELLLMFAARIQHVETVIKPALAAGKWVVSDRFVDSSYAYQGYGRKLPLDIIKGLDDLILQQFVPDLTVWLDIDPEIGLKRIGNREALDRFEVENLSFFNDIRKGFTQRQLDEPERIIRIDVDKPLDQVQNDIACVLRAFIERA